MREGFGRVGVEPFQTATPQSTIGDVGLSFWCRFGRPTLTSLRLPVGA